MKRLWSTALGGGNFNLYGPSCYGEQVGILLGDAKVFLQEPSGLPPSMAYCNPHVYSRTEELLTPFFVNQQPDQDYCFDQEIEKILCQTHHGEQHSILEQDSRIKTPLKPHQLAALEFMLRREATDGKSLAPKMWKQIRINAECRYTHELTRAKRDALENECVGGLLADEMGLGKSLSLLALIVHTLEEAQRFMTDSPAASSHQSPRTGATLIVTPYSTLQNRQDELSRHFDADALRLYVHHGQAKSRLHSKLATAQVVLTTYETITWGQKSSSGHLGQFSWFRIALDEAHWIRNRSPQVFQVLHEFEAQRRWCLTGTPVQNGLGDLCALTRWLRFYPFNTSRGFKKFITDPLSRRDQAGLSNLRRMASVFQIRRMKDGMGLGSMTIQTTLVSLSGQERKQYDMAKAAMLQCLASPSKTRNAGHYTIVLKGIQELRRICCDGKTLQNSTAHHCASITALSEKIACNQCGRTIGKATWPSTFHGQCGHVLCKVCRTNSVTNSTEPRTEEGSCPICGTIEEDPVLRGGLSATSAYDGFQQAVAFPPEPDTRDSVPAKIGAVVSKLLERHQEPFRIEGKSLVFSYWKHALALLEIQLHRRGIRSVRIDGDRSQDERERALSAFRTDPEVRVMLLTFGTGSVDLTLTEASHVHLVEPHWNPMAEEQAIARAHRIEQDKPVTMWRCMVENSIEENIVRKQQRKLYLAKIAHSNQETEPASGNTRKERRQQDDEKLEGVLQDCHLFQG